jgi:hypothetical protein
MHESVNNYNVLEIRNIITHNMHNVMIFINKKQTHFFIFIYNDKKLIFKLRKVQEIGLVREIFHPTIGI